MKESEVTQEDISRHIKVLLNRNISLKEAVSIVSETFDVNRKIIYKLALDVMNDD